MARWKTITAVPVIAALSAALSLGVLGQATLTLRFEDMDPHLGQAFALRIVEEGSHREVSRISVSEIIAPTFDLEMSALQVGTSHRIDFYADVNGNGAYDAPPADHAWRIGLPSMEGDTLLTFSHNVDFTDIAWPPHLDGAIEPLEYASTMEDPETRMSVHWQHDGTILYVGLVAPGTGWLSIGFEPERMMQGANIIIAAIDGGELVIEDHYGNAPTSHRADDIDHVLQAAGREIDGRSVLEFAIPLDSGDDQDKPLAPGTEITIILAYHLDNDRLTSRHTARSTASLVLAE